MSDNAEKILNGELSSGAAANLVEALESERDTLKAELEGISKLYNSHSCMIELDELRMHVASIGDALNQELRENGPADVGQYYRTEDLKNGVRFLVDVMRRKSDALLAKEREARKEAYDRGFKEATNMVQSANDVEIAALKSELEVLRFDTKQAMEDAEALERAEVRLSILEPALKKAEETARSCRDREHGAYATDCSCPECLALKRADGLARNLNKAEDRIKHLESVLKDAMDENTKLRGGAGWTKA